jgi:hypothetical protein
MRRLLCIILFISYSSGKTYPFTEGESLYYKALFSGIEAGQGALKVIGKDTINNISVLHVRFSAKTHGFIDKIYPINDVINIWLDEHSLLPIKVEKHISEGKYNKNKQILLNHNDQFAIIKGDTLPIPLNTHSPYSLLYFLRNKNLESLHGKEFVTIDGKKITLLTMNIHENIELDIPLGQFTCTEVTPTNINKQNFKNESSMSIWFTNNFKRYPAQITIKMKFGDLTLKLYKIIN